MAESHKQDRSSEDSKVSFCAAGIENEGLLVVTYWYVVKLEFHYWYIGFLHRLNVGSA